VPKFETTKTFAHPRDVLFNLVTDIERYPDFVPGINKIVICEKLNNQNLTIASVTFGKAPLVFEYKCKIVIDSPNRVTVTAIDGPFNHLISEWIFTENHNGGTIVSFNIDFQLKNKFLAKIADPLLEKASLSTIEAFSERAKKISV